MAREQVTPGLEQSLVITAVGAEERGGGIATQQHDGRAFGAGRQRASKPDEKKEGTKEGRRDGSRHGYSHSFGE